MKKLPIALKTPARVLIAVGLIVLVGEFLIMLLIESIHTAALKVGFLENVDWKFADPIMLAAFVSPALYFLIFRALNQQAELERQLDELRRFQNVTVGRELRMKELVEEIAALRRLLSAESTGNIPVTSGSPEAPRDAPEQYIATQATEDSQRSTLLFMLEDLEAARKKIEQAHLEWMAALDVVDDPIFLHDKEFHILRCNKAYQQRAGIPFHELIGQPYYEIFPKTGTPLAGCLRVMEKAEAAADEEEITFGDTTYRSRTFSVYGKQGAYLHSAHILENITERKWAEVALKGSEEKNRLLFENSRDALMILAPPSWNFTGANQATLKLFGASSVAEFIALGPWEVSPERQPDGRPSSEKAQEMITTAMREGSHFFEWEHQRLDGQPFAADVLLTRMKVGEDVFLQATVRDITERKQAEAELREGEEKLRSSLEDTVRAMAGLVEMRDPYTAGHQARVADLAAAIARQMGLPEEQVHAIHLAGMVFDLGKIQVPAEILSKPGKISDSEYGLIKIHPQAGYDILKDIDFPWPIAQVVLQHHERLDGSGYPQGLKGEEILPGARILGVADTVEAMCSHRPYRESLGLEAALEEITMQRGIHYDAVVVDACLAVFREQGYSFKS